MIGPSPDDYSPLDVEQEWTKLREALRRLDQPERVTVERLERPTLGALRERLRAGEFHVFHFIGHGGFDPKLDDGVLILEDAGGGIQQVTGEDLGGLLNDHEAMRLAVLNACEGARADDTDPFAGTAQSLIQQGLSAVVAMQFEITDQPRSPSPKACTVRSSDGDPIDAALVEARKAIRYDLGNLVEWATPVLYLRAPDGRIFDVTLTTIRTPSAEREAAEREAAEREAAEREAAEKETAEKETAEKETAEKETAEKETAEKETAEGSVAEKEIEEPRRRPPRRRPPSGGLGNGNERPPSGGLGNGNERPPGCGPRSCGPRSCGPRATASTARRSCSVAETTRGPSPSAPTSGGSSATAPTPHSPPTSPGPASSRSGQGSSRLAGD